MFARARHHLTYANVMATLAVFAALGGTSYAALTITGKNVKNGSLTGADIKNNSLKSVDVANGSLLAKDFKPGQLVAGAPGPKGNTGATGAQGPKGDPGPRGPSFGDGVNADVVAVPQCGTATLASYQLSITQPSRLFVSGQAYYRKYGTDRPENPAIEVQLYNAAGTTLLARTAQMVGGSLSTSVNTDDPLTTSGMLMTDADPDARVPYAVAPGTYQLRLQGWSYGNCSASAIVSMAGISLSHIVLGTAP